MTYDRYANLTAISSTKCSAPGLSLSVNTHNQFTNTGFNYDAAGDLTADGLYSYAWNAEAHLTSAAGVTYTYDGGLRRVKKSSGTLYWYCATCGNVLAESDLSGNIISEYALFNGQRIARRDVSSGNIYYIFSDRLGSYRTLTDSTGNVKGESDYYPFGGERVISSTVTDSFRFAGMEWDSEDGLNDTLYRKYTPAQGRWETADPKRGCVSFPQGHNLYAYVKDNATNLVDPLGDIVMCGQGCSIYDGSCCTPCDPTLDPTCGGGGGYPLPGTGGGGGGGLAPAPSPPQQCDPCSDPTCPGVCLGPVGGTGSGGGGGPLNPCETLGMPGYPDWARACAQQPTGGLCVKCCQREKKYQVALCVAGNSENPPFALLCATCVKTVQANNCFKNCPK